MEQKSEKSHSFFAEPVQHRRYAKAQGIHVSPAAQFVGTHEVENISRLQEFWLVAGELTGAVLYALVYRDLKKSLLTSQYWLIVL